MTRLNIILLMVLIMVSLGTVTAQHKARKMYFELEQEQNATKQYGVEWSQLQLEQSTWGNPARIEQIATNTLKMQVPDSKRIQLVNPESKAKAVELSVEKGAGT